MHLNTLTKLLFFLLLPILGHGADKDDFIIYETQFRSAEDLVKVAEGLKNGARVNSLNSKVIIAGTKSQREELLRLFKALDHKLKIYKVSIRAAGKSAGSSDSRAVEGSVGGRNAGVGKRSGILKRGSGGKVGVAGDFGSAAISAESLEEKESRGSEHRLSVSEGGSGLIEAGSGLFPSSMRVYLRAAGKSGVHVELRQVDSHGSEIQEMASETDIPLGQWRTLGGIRSQEQGGQGELLGASKRARDSEKAIQLKVDLEADEGNSR